MIVLPDFLKPYIIDNQYAPILPKYFWTFNSSILDFTLSPLNFIEESMSTVLKVSINGLELLIPYNWYILITDADTNKLDYIQINECTVIDSHAYLMSPIDSHIRLAHIKVLDVIEDTLSYYPVLQKNTALCSPVSQEINKQGIEVPLSIVIGPYDLYKSVANKSVGDLF
jgi:hypothetical protein